MFHKRLALLLAVSILLESVLPYQLMALTSGPSQPEFSSFEPVNTTQMVDLFTGNFNYNIPLLNIPGPNGGYPVNLFYKSTVNLEEEASMVGLGWNLGIGAITREVRGLPDDFNNENILRTTYIKDDFTVGVTGSVSLEVFGLDVSKAGLRFSVTPMYNSYKGIGLAVDASPYRSSNELTGSLGLGFNSFEGVNTHAGFATRDKTKPSAGLSVNRSILDGQTQLNYKPYGQNIPFNDRPSSFPSYDLPFNSLSYSASFKAGAEFFATFPEGQLTANFDVRSFANNGRQIKLPAYGFQYSAEGQTNSGALLDFNRIKDRSIRRQDKNLPVPVTTEDQYSISGQGTGGSFALGRSDIGKYSDKATTGFGGGVTIGADFGAGNIVKGGLDAGIRFSTDLNTARKSSNVPYSFTKSEFAKSFEPVFFYKMGEMTGEVTENNRTNWPDQSTNGARAANLYEDYSYMGNDEIVDFALKTDGLQYFVPILKDNLRNTRTNEFLPSKASRYKRVNRKPKATVIQGIKGKDLFQGENCVVPFLDVKCLDAIQATNISYNGEALTSKPASPKNDQIAAFIEHQTNGSRYVYGLPAVNFKKRDVVFSVNAPSASSCEKNLPIPMNPSGTTSEEIQHKNPGSENYLDILQTNSFVHSYMLTSILGDDYVDTDINDGLPNDKDRGYWVKFDYVRTNNKTNPYKWRFPFAGAQLQKGQKALTEDDKASFSYGEKEQYYPLRIETNTHFAVFSYSKRTDSRGALQEINTFNVDDKHGQVGAYAYRLDKIELYTKGKESIKEKEIVFTYFDSGLCPGIFNADKDDLSKGKLTLKKVTINNFGTKRANDNPYEFDYFGLTGVLPTYAENATDRWGVYKSNQNGKECQNFDHPYTDQTSGNQEVERLHLKSITMPSGSKINLKLSRDHYAYVQDRQAGEMFQIKKIGNNVADGNGRIDISKKTATDNSELFVYVQAKNSSDDPMSYFEDLYKDANGAQVVVKLRSQMLDDPDPNHNIYEDVSGPCYVDLSYAPTKEGDLIKFKVKPFDFNGTTIAAYGNSEFNRHPFILLNWQYLKVNLRKLLTPGPTISGSTKAAAENAVEQFKNIASSVLKIFQGFYTRCYNYNYGMVIDGNNSFVRLTSPDKKKFGGDIKVDKITMTNIWDTTTEYGNVYLYEEEETSDGYKKGKSFGVATNEPQLGSEENSFYYYKSTVDDLLWNSNEFSFTQYPFNDANMPGSSVGYSKVVVRSLSSHYEFLDNLQSSEKNNVYTFGPITDPNVTLSTTGQVDHEFYTARDFPVSFKNSNINSSNYKFKYFIIPFVATVVTDGYTATQGYLFEGNDMHGKPRKITNYAQCVSGKIAPSPISYVETIYKSKEETYTLGSETRKINKVVSDVDLQLNFKAPYTTKKGELGVNRQIYTDVRHVTSISSDIGFAGNLDAFLAIFFPVAVPTFIPDITANTTVINTGVVNKSVIRSGIVAKTIAFDGQSKVETDNLVFDPYSGAPTLTSVNNEFNQKKFNYTLPAYLGYNRMGAANINAGFEYQFSRNKNGDLAYAYSYNGIPGMGGSGPYKVDYWKIGGVNVVVNVQFNTLDELVSIMNQNDPSGGIWSIDPVTKNIVGGASGTPYEVLRIVQLAENNAVEISPTQTTIFIVGIDSCTGLVAIRLHIDNSKRLFIPGDELIFTKESCNGNPKTADQKTIGVFIKRSVDCNQAPVYLFDVAGGINFFTQANNETCKYKTLNIRSGNRNLLNATGQSLIAFNLDPNLSTGDITISEGVNILDAAAMEYNDHWHYKDQAYNCGGGGGGGGESEPNRSGDLVLNNEFSKGAKGIFRPSTEYKFRAQRDNSVVVKKGVFASGSGYNLYDWENIQYKSTSDGSKWLTTAAHTKMDRLGAVVESKNALDIFSAALQVKKSRSVDAQATDVLAMAKNSRYYELGTTSFESYELYGNSDGFQNNLDCFTSDATNYLVKKENVYNVLFRDGNNSFVIDKKYDSNENYTNYKAEVYYPEQTGLTNSFLANSSPFTVSSFGGYTKITITNNVNCGPTNSSLFAKSIALYKEQNPLGNSGMIIDSSFAHAGKNALKLTNNATFVNKGLELKLNQKYSFSCWLSDQNFANLDLQDDGVTVIIAGVTMVPVGQKINGWQQVRGSFVADANSELTFNFAKGSLGVLYVDDLRVHPFEAEMTTYVYDSKTYQLAYTLDDNNFFTKYVYDYNGELIAVQKETERGVKTIKESRSFLKKAQ